MPLEIRDEVKQFAEQMEDRLRDDQQTVVPKDLDVIKLLEIINTAKCETENLLSNPTEDSSQPCENLLDIATTSMYACTKLQLDEQEHEKAMLDQAIGELLEFKKPIEKAIEEVELRYNKCLDAYEVLNTVSNFKLLLTCKINKKNIYHIERTLGRVHIEKHG